MENKIEVTENAQIQINKILTLENSKFFRITNEIPTILLILIVFLAILKPF